MQILWQVVVRYQQRPGESIACSMITLCLEGSSGYLASIDIARLATGAVCTTCLNGCSGASLMKHIWSWSLIFMKVMP